MDGVHDLGGKQGFGPIPLKQDERAYQEEWEGRAYAMVQTVGPSEGTIDWFRHLVELLPPAAYLNEPYFQKWQFVQLVELLQGGMLSMDEILSGKAAEKGDPAEVKSLERVLARIGHKTCSFEAPCDTGPAFTVGDTIRTKRHMHDGHTRLPAYARDRVGTIIAHHGAHVLPDEGARGEKIGVHLYTVRFEAHELWGAEANPIDDVTLDLWETYLVQP